MIFVSILSGELLGLYFFTLCVCAYTSVSLGLQVTRLFFSEMPGVRSPYECDHLADDAALSNRFCLIIQREISPQWHCDGHGNGHGNGHSLFVVFSFPSLFFIFQHVMP